ncbi:MAG: DUF3592 domain-containing protein [Deltaproteobacteria bacterium]|nr:DUF3592 domain-containing protein [Deltaproteobacteria bacterium]
MVVSLILLLAGLARLYLMRRELADFVTPEIGAEAQAAVLSCEPVWALGGRKGRSFGYAPRVNYQYMTPGGRYAGERVPKGAWAAEAAGVEAWCGLHPAGSAIAIRYDPNNQARSSLAYGEHAPASHLEGVAAILMVIIGAAGAIGALKGVLPLAKEKG